MRQGVEERGLFMKMREGGREVEEGGFKMGRMSFRYFVSLFRAHTTGWAGRQIVYLDPARIGLDWISLIPHTR